MEAILATLHASPPESLGFSPDLEIRAFLLQRQQGNVLVYRSASLEQDVEAVNEIGGISRQYLNHWHEASPACDWVATTFDAPLHCHVADAPEVAETCSVAETFAERHYFDDDFEVIPTPGHTPGATAYLWNSGEHRALFTGDTIFFSNGKWRAALLEGTGHRQRHIESLQLIRELDFDVVIPGVASRGQPLFAKVDKADAQQRIDRIIERLRDGANG